MGFDFVRPENIRPAVAPVTVLAPGRSVGGGTIPIANWPGAWTAFPKRLTAVRGGVVVGYVDTAGYGTGALTGVTGVEGTDPALQAGDTLHSRMTAGSYDDLGNAINTNADQIESVAIPLATGTTVPRVIGDRFAERINVKDFDAVGDGTTDDTAAIVAAIERATTTTVSVYFPAGTYLVTDTLIDPSVATYDLRGERTARGAGTPADWAAVTIKFRPADTTKPLIAVYQVGSSATYMIGPYYQENIRFDVGDANGLVFGARDSNFDGTPDIVEDSPSASLLQSYVTNVRIKECAFVGTNVDRASVNGVITRSGRVLLSLTKCFESVITNCSFTGCDTQVLLWGCDNPNFSGCRSQTSHIPFDMYGSGTFGTKYTIRDLQVEGWTFSPVSSYDCQLVIQSCEFEQNDGAPHGSGRYSLTGGTTGPDNTSDPTDSLGYTVSVTRFSPTLTFSHAMDGILFPGKSILEIVNGGLKLHAMVETVSGTTVTIRDVTAIPWTASGLSVVRIHGVGPIHDGRSDASLTDCHGGASLNSPAYVYVLNRGSMHIKASGTRGSENDNRSLPIGNRCLQQFYMNSCMSFDGTSAVIAAPPEHPLAVVSGQSENYGSNAMDANARAPLGSLDTAMATVSRKWALTPKRCGSYINTSDANLIAFVNVPGDQYTDQSIWAWQIGIAGTNQGLNCCDPTLPNDPNITLRIRFRARSVTGAADLNYAYFGRVFDIISSNHVITLDTTWRTYEVVVACPDEWQNPLRTDSAGFLVQAQGVYLAGITVEEIYPDEALDPAIQTALDGKAPLDSDGTLTTPFLSFVPSAPFSVPAIDVLGGNTGQWIRIYPNVTATDGVGRVDIGGDLLVSQATTTVVNGVLSVRSSAEVKSSSPFVVVNRTDTAGRASYVWQNATVTNEWAACIETNDDPSPALRFHSGTMNNAMVLDQSGNLAITSLACSNIRDAADDAAAAALTPAVPVNGFYRTGSTLKIRVS